MIDIIAEGHAIEQDLIRDCVRMTEGLNDMVKAKNDNKEDPEVSMLYTIQYYLDLFKSYADVMDKGITIPCHDDPDGDPISVEGNPRKVKAPNVGTISQMLRILKDCPDTFVRDHINIRVVSESTDRGNNAEMHLYFGDEFLSKISVDFLFAPETVDKLKQVLDEDRKRESLSTEYSKMIMKMNAEISRLRGEYDKLVKQSFISDYNGRAVKKEKLNKIWEELEACIRSRDMVVDEYHKTMTAGKIK